MRDMAIQPALFTLNPQPLPTMRDMPISAWHNASPLTASSPLSGTRSCAPPLVPWAPQPSPSTPSMPPSAAAAGVHGCCGCCRLCAQLRSLACCRACQGPGSSSRQGDHWAQQLVAVVAVVAVAGVCVEGAVCAGAPSGAVLVAVAAAVAVSRGGVEGAVCSGTLSVLVAASELVGGCVQSSWRMRERRYWMSVLAGPA